jgi:hypothetical protein
MEKDDNFYPLNEWIMAENVINFDLLKSDN